MFLGYTTNDYGTPVSEHKCDECGRTFTVCPIPIDPTSPSWAGCLAPECRSYDPERDVDALFEQDETCVKRLPPRGTA